MTTKEIVDFWKRKGNGQTFMYIGSQGLGDIITSGRVLQSGGIYKYEETFASALRLLDIKDFVDVTDMPADQIRALQVFYS